LKVLIISYEFAPLSAGAATYARELAVGLSKNQAEVYILTAVHGASSQVEKYDKELYKKYGINIYRIRGFGKLFFLQLYFKIIKLFGINFESKFDYIILADARAVRFSILFIPSRYYNRCLNVFHGGQIFHMYLNPNILLKISGIHKKYVNYLKQSKINITVSAHLKRTFMHYIPEIESNIKTIYHGIDLEIFYPISNEERSLIRQRYNLNPGDFVIFSGSRLIPEKGQDYLLKAIAPIVSENIKIVIAGSGNYYHVLLQLTESLGIKKNVIFTGDLIRQEMAKLIAASDLAVMLSRIPYESFGLVNIEANACAVPVLAAKNAGIPEAVEEGISGFLVDPINIEEIRTTLKNILNINLLKEMGIKAHQRVLEKFTCDRMAKDVISVLQELPTSKC